MNKASQQLPGAAAILALSLFLLAACSQPSQQTTSGTPNQTQTRTQEKQVSTADDTSTAKDLCALLKTEDISKLAGVTFTRTEHKIKSTTNRNISDCYYFNNETTSIAIIANYDNKYTTAKQSFRELADYQAKQGNNFPAEKISGVGEEAFILETGTVTQINALNKNVWLTLSVYTRADKAAQKEQAIAIAKKAFEVL